jgi:predicted deacylase
MVKAGDVIVRLTGAKALETDLAALQKEIDGRVKPELEKATADLTAATTANNKDAMTKAQAVVTDRQKSLDDKQGKVTTKTSELEKFVIKAPADGKLSTVAKVGQKVAASEVVAKLAPMPVLAVVLKAPALAANSAVMLAIKNSDKKLSCTVASVEGDNAKVTCPAEPAVADGTDVVLVK